MGQKLKHCIKADKLEKVSHEIYICNQGRLIDPKFIITIELRSGYTALRKWSLAVHDVHDFSLVMSCIHTKLVKDKCYYSSKTTTYCNRYIVVKMRSLANNSIRTRYYRVYSDGFENTTALMVDTIYKQLQLGNLTEGMF